MVPRTFREHTIVSLEHTANFKFQTNLKSSANSKSPYTCFSCGHTERNYCRLCNSVCHKCSQKWHIASVCNYSKNVHIVTHSPNEELFRISSTTKDGIFVTMNIKRKDVSMQVDTGCDVSIVTYSVYKEFSDNVTLETGNTRLHTYTGEHINLHGK